jgi:hypothetical protein
MPLAMLTGAGGSICCALGSSRCPSATSCSRTRGTSTRARPSCWRRRRSADRLDRRGRRDAAAGRPVYVHVDVDVERRRPAEDALPRAGRPVGGRRRGRWRTCGTRATWSRCR